MIDGNSLLNRAFYAMKIFTTKEGMPTNGIFGFVKLLYKIVEDEKPKYIVVTFDVHQPTFRHKMYDAYKGTRKPMPEELVVQVPVLKEVLRAMQIKTVELGGYEADDVIGTLSSRFTGVRSVIFTGDRDSYQLVGENVEVCFTKKGVTDLDRLTAENFFEKVGLYPSQIVDEKALMGDSSDNIPGVMGIGPKSATTLLRTYGTLDEIYAHLDEIAPPLREKLIAGKESAYLSRTLATIDRNVPIDTTLDECALVYPFPAETREQFARLEFRSLMGITFAEEVKEITPVVECNDFESVFPLIDAAKEFALCAEPEGFYLYVGGKEFLFRLRENFLTTGFFLNEMRPLFERLFSGGKTAILAEMKSVAHLLREVGVELACEVEDVTLMRYMADSNQRPIDPKLLSKDFVLPESNCARALMLARDEAKNRMAGTPEEKLLREVEAPLSYVLFDMERTGVRVDIAKFPEFSDKFNRELAALSDKIYDLAGVSEFNINSPFQLSSILFDKLGFDPHGAKKTQRGGYSTSADVLEKLAEEHEIARLILRYREIQKLQSTYIDGIRPLVNGDIVHTTYNQTMTTTGRLSSTNPNLQNIPVRTAEGRELRKLFIAREGNVLVDADYSQIELRLLAHFSGCKELIQAYRNGEDIHASTAARVFNVPLDAVTPAMRRRAKTINFGIIYGMSAFGLAKDLNCTSSEAQKLINKYFEMYSAVKEYMEENVRFAKENGYVTTILGRKRYIAEIRSVHYNMRQFGERAAMNMPLQGSAADIIKLAMLHVADRLERDGFRAKLVLQVHDELVLDAPLEEQERAAAMLKEEMESAISLNVPLIADVSVGKSWYDAK